MPLLLSPFTPVFDQVGKLRTDARVYVYTAGTTTPAAIYLDADFGAPAENPLQTESGLLPALYVQSGSYRIRAVDSANAPLRDFDNITVGSTSAVPDEGEPVEPGEISAASVFQTGDIKARYGIGELTGWVRANGKTIGSADSGATERASADAEALFLYLWAANTSLTVSGGRGANANSDWTANKNIALPDLRGRALTGLDDMGSSPAARLGGVTFSTGTATTLGSYGGTATHTLTTEQLPSHTHTGTVTVNSGGAHTHPIPYRYGDYANPGAGGVSLTNRVGEGSVNASGVSGEAAAHTHTATMSINSTGTSAPFSLMPPFALVSFYIKL